ncbi:hypothetical protein ACOMHN_056922 [Nucella lapillus]
MPPDLPPDHEGNDLMPSDLPPDHEGNDLMPPDLPPDHEGNDLMPPDLPPDYEGNDLMPPDLPPDYEGNDLMPPDLPPDHEGNDLMPPDLPSDHEGNDLMPPDLPPDHEGNDLMPSDLCGPCWISVQWWHPHSTFSRVLACWVMIVFWQLSELNTFFLKHIFYVPPSHVLNLLRLLLICVISAPTIRQYYVYVTDPRCKRLGTQCWVFVAITLIETIISIKFGTQMFKETVITNVLIWLIIQLHIYNHLFPSSILCPLGTSKGLV